MYCTEVQEGNKYKHQDQKLFSLNLNLLSSHLFLSVPPIRLLGQLNDTETAFDDFWERHHTKLEQCLQLRHFEKSFREVSWFRLRREKKEAVRLLFNDETRLKSLLLPRCAASLT